MSKNKSELKEQANLVESIAMSHAHPFQEVEELSEWNEVHDFAESVNGYLEEDEECEASPQVALILYKLQNTIKRELNEEKTSNKKDVLNDILNEIDILAPLLFPQTAKEERK